MQRSSFGSDRSSSSTDGNSKLQQQQPGAVASTGASTIASLPSISFQPASPELPNPFLIDTNNVGSSSALADKSPLAAEKKSPPVPIAGQKAKAKRVYLRATHSQVGVHLPADGPLECCYPLFVSM